MCSQEVVPFGQGDDVVDLVVHLHHPRVGLLVHDDAGELDLVIGHEDGGDLVIDNVLDLIVTNAKIYG